MAGQETVILVHGLWMHGVVMTPLQWRVERCGYRAVNYSYPSMRLSFAENAARLAHFCKDFAAPRLHFVGHSLGGLVILGMLQREPPPNTGRIVLVGPPALGSHAAQRLARLPGGRALLGHSIPEWLAGAAPQALERHEIGVIAGSLGIGLGRLIAPDLPEPNDGVVSVAETRLPAARDHIVLHVSHATMLFSTAVARQVCAFLERGVFEHLQNCQNS